MTKVHKFLLALACVASTAARTCDVSAFGALPNGGSDTNSEALQAALDDATCDEVLLSGGGTFKSSALHVTRSDVTLTIDAGTALEGDDKKVKQCDDETKWTADGWCAFLTVSAARNFTLRGAGTLVQGGSQGVHYSALHVVSTVGVHLGAGTSTRVHCTNSWWCNALHNASAVHVQNLFVDGSKGRDGIDFVNCRDVLVEGSRIEGSDDGLCFKTQADSGLGAYPAADVLVRDSSISSECCNAIMFGSRTEVDMSNFTFRNVSISSGRKSAIGIVSMDSANITGLRFENISIHGIDVATPLFLKLGNRASGEYGKHSWTVGSISDVNFTNITADLWGHVKDPSKGRRSSYTATIEGRNASFPVGPIRLTRVLLTAPGGGKASDATRDPPNNPDAFQPRYDGARPAWGWFVRHAVDVNFEDCAASLADGPSSDGRPAIVMDDVRNIRWTGGHVTAAAGCQVRLRDAVGSDLNGTGVLSCAWLPTPSPPPPHAPTPPPAPTPAGTFVKHDKAYCSTAGTDATRVSDHSGVSLDDCEGQCSADASCSCFDHRDKNMRRGKKLKAMEGGAIEDKDECRLYHGHPAIMPSSDGYSAYTRTAAGSSATAAAPPPTPPVGSVWPIPQHMSSGSTAAQLRRPSMPGGFFNLTAPAASALLARAFARAEAELFNNCSGSRDAGSGSAVALVTGIDVVVRNSSEALQLGASEGYSLALAGGVGRIEAAGVFGVVRALQTLAQLVTGCGALVPALPLRVHDAPRYPWRGLMVDSARHFLPLPALRRVVDGMAMSKLNVLHLHLTDAQSFSFGSTAVPELPATGAFSGNCSSPFNPLPASTGRGRGNSSSGGSGCTYSPTELRELVAFARDRGVRVVPEIDMPSHVASWCAALPALCLSCNASTTPAGVPANGSFHQGCSGPRAPAACGWGYFAVLNPASATAWSLVAALLREIAGVFDDAHLHLGFDEVHWDCYDRPVIDTWMRDTGVAAPGDYKGVVRWMLARAQQLARAAGRTAVVWNEAFDQYGAAAYPPATPPPGELDCATVVHLWYSPEWYDPPTGLSVGKTVADVVRSGRSALVSFPWYLNANASAGPSFAALYLQDVDSNKTCASNGTGGVNCTCLGRQGDVEDGCYDVAGDERVLGGEAALWGEAVDGANLLPSVFMAAAVVGERLWSPRDALDVQDAQRRLLLLQAKMEERGLGGTALPPFAPRAVGVAADFTATARVKE